MVVSDWLFSIVRTRFIIENDYEKRGNFFKIRWRTEIRDDPSPSNDEGNVRCDPTSRE